MMEIQNQEIQVKEFNGQRVVTLKDIDLVHERPSGTASRNFKSNRQHFIEGEDFYIVHLKDEIRPLGFQIPNRGLTLITESGYLMLVKSFTDDLAWAVQRQLVNCYFRVKEEQETVEVSLEEALTKKDLIKIADCISRTSNEGLPLLKIILNKLAPGEFENVQNVKVVISNEKQPNEVMEVEAILPPNFPQLLLIAIKGNGLSQNQFAKELGVGKATISNYVNGVSKPSMEIVSKISSILNVDFF